MVCDEVEEGEYRELIGGELRKGNANEGDVLDKKYKCDITYKDLGQYHGGGDIRGGGWVSGSG